MVGIDSKLPNDFANSVIHGLGVLTTVITMSVVGGPLFVLAAAVFAVLYFNSGCLIRYLALDVTHADVRDPTAGKVRLA